QYLASVVCVAFGVAVAVAVAPVGSSAASACKPPPKSVPTSIPTSKMAPPATPSIHVLRICALPSFCDLWADVLLWLNVLATLYVGSSHGFLGNESAFEIFSANTKVGLGHVLERQSHPASHLRSYVARGYHARQR